MPSFRPAYTLGANWATKWTSSTNVTALDALSATRSVPAGQSPLSVPNADICILQLGNVAAQMPAGATITSIRILIRTKASVAGKIYFATAAVPTSGSKLWYASDEYASTTEGFLSLLEIKAIGLGNADLADLNLYFEVGNTYTSAVTAYIDYLEVTVCYETQAQKSVVKSIAGGASVLTALSGSPSWTTPANAQALNAAEASCVLGTSGNALYGQYLWLNTLGLALPDDAFVTGFRVRLFQRASVASRARLVKLDVGEIPTNSVSGDALITNTALGILEFGGSTERFGRADGFWRPAGYASEGGVNDANFGLLIQYRNSTASAVTAYVDGFELEAYYTLPPDGIPQWSNI